MNSLKEKAKTGVLFLTVTAMFSSVPGFGMETAYAQVLDIDGNGVADAGTDGLLINRYLYESRGNALTDAAVGADCTRCTASAIEAYLAAQTPATLDIDGNGVADGGSDGLLINRYLYEFRGSALINVAVDQNCTRCTASAIEAYLAALTASFTNGLGMTFNLIPAGTFTMGSPTDEPGRYDDETQHQVTLTQAFYIQTTEVGQWEAVMGSNPSDFSECGDNCPVEQVSWDDVQEFITKMNERGEGTYRLPTEAEWEYAARAGTGTAIYTGSVTILGDRNAPELDPIAWYGGNSCVSYGGGYDCSTWSERQYDCSNCGTHPVAQKQANAYGLYDMLGNVWEWCQEWYGDYPTDSVTDPTGPGTGSIRVFRGGSWGSYARSCRSASRYWNSPDYRNHNYGFRLALSPGQP